MSNEKAKKFQLSYVDLLQLLSTLASEPFPKDARLVGIQAGNDAMELLFASESYMEVIGGDAMFYAPVIPHKPTELAKPKVSESKQG